MERRTKESKCSATIRRRKNRGGALAYFLNWQHRQAGAENECDSDNEDGSLFLKSSDEFLASSKLVRALMSSRKRLLWGLIVFRVLNALLIQTSYVPDEYWQSTEVAHQMAFGYGYLTWEWHHGLRGYLYPSVFAVLYKVLAMLCMDSRTFIIKMPRVLHGVGAAICDWYVYRLSLRLCGPRVALWTLFCQLSSWFQFYCLTRTLTNSVETILTAVGLYYFPWPSRPRKSEWQYIPIVALAVTVRPTAAIIWIWPCLWHMYSHSIQYSVAKTAKQIAIRGFPVLLLSLVIDRTFYGKWVNVYYNFLEFNFLSDLGSFYGSHSWHWYFSNGLIVVLGTHVFPLVVAARKGIEPAFLGLIFWTVFIYSFLSHKEFRFVMGILPAVMHICGNVLHRFLDSNDDDDDDGSIIDDGDNHGANCTDATSSESHRKKPASVRKKKKNSLKATALLILIAVNLPLALYTCLIHQRGTLDVMSYLYKEAQKPAVDPVNVLFLMPCHSTPFYCYVHQNISMRFLTCEPNVLRLTNYTDEADVFYNNPELWLVQNYFGDNATTGERNGQLPTHIVMFDELFLKMPAWLVGHRSGYEQCARFFHTHFPEGRVGSSVLVLCSVQWAKQVSTRQFVFTADKTM